MKTESKTGKIAIITDSVGQLSPEQAEQWGIRVVPMEVTVDGKKYYDGINLESNTLYKRMRQEPDLPLSTSAPSAGEFYKVIMEAVNAGAESILYVGLTCELSSTLSAAQGAITLVGEQLGNRQIRLYDTRMATIAQGFLAIEAARAAAEGFSLDQIIEHLDQERKRLGLIAVVETLTYLARGGRIGKAAYLVGSAIQIHPLLTIDDHGIVTPAGMSRSFKSALEKMVNYIERKITETKTSAQAKPDYLKVAVMHADTLEWAENLRQRVIERLHPDEVFLTDFTPVMTVHTGPGLLGLAFHLTENKLKSIQL